MRDCRIEGGYGRSPTHGQLFDVRTAGLLARFDSCVLDYIGIKRLHPGSTVVFANCTLRNILDMDSADMPQLPGVSFPGSTLFPSSQPHDTSFRKDLSDLFPNWPTRIEPK